MVDWKLQITLFSVAFLKINLKKTLQLNYVMHILRKPVVFLSHKKQHVVSSIVNMR